MWPWNRYKKTNFKSDDLVLNRDLDFKSSRSPDEFIAPKTRDNRDLCLPTNDQSNTPNCAGYAIAGYIEVKYWKTNHRPIQFNADKIYLKSKELDRKPNKKGTSLDYAFKAAIELGYTKEINKTNELLKVDDYKDIKFNIHEDDVLVGGFSITSDWNLVDKNGNIADSANYNYLGGHAVLICGYDEKGIWIQNSWGYMNWGLYGFGHLSWGQVADQFIYGMRLK